MVTPRSLHHLYAAYAFTWAIHIGYVIYLLRGYLRVKNEAEELGRE
jgi:hypothetical protein